MSSESSMVQSQDSGPTTGREGTCPHSESPCAPGNGSTSGVFCRPDPRDPKSNRPLPQRTLRHVWTSNPFFSVQTLDSPSDLSTSTSTNLGPPRDTRLLTVRNLVIRSHLPSASCPRVSRPPRCERTLLFQDQPWDHHLTSVNTL